MFRKLGSGILFPSTELLQIFESRSCGLSPLRLPASERGAVTWTNRDRKVLRADGNLANYRTYPIGRQIKTFEGTEFSPRFMGNGRKLLATTTPNGT